MILIVGGRCQGKRSFAEGLIQRGEIKPVSAETAGADGTIIEPGEVFRAGVICHLELYVRQCMKEKKDPAAWVEHLCKENPNAVVIADEIGCGIVPADAFEREYRETVGRICQKLAAQSEAVYRVVCGIGNRIK